MWWWKYTTVGRLSPLCLPPYVSDDVDAPHFEGSADNAHSILNFESDRRERSVKRVVACSGAILWHRKIVALQGCHGVGG